MYEALKAIAEANGWVFEYGRSDFQNLYEAAEKKCTPQLFLDPVEIRDIDNDTGVTEQEVHTGSFMIMYSSDLDEIDYAARYAKYIKPIIQGALKTLKESLRCGYDVTFVQWKTVEVINVFSYNFDGVMCTYVVTFDV